MKKLSLIVFFNIAGIIAFAQENVKPMNDSSNVSAEKMKHHHHSDKAAKRQERAAMLKELNLTPEQDEKMKAVRQQNKSKKMAIKNDAQLTKQEKDLKLKEVHQAEAAEINTVLTPEQKEKMKTAKQEMKAKRQQQKIEKKKNTNSPA